MFVLDRDTYLSLFLVDIEGSLLGHVETPPNVNEKQLVEELMLRVLRESSGRILGDGEGS